MPNHNLNAMKAEARITAQSVFADTGHEKNLSVKTFELFKCILMCNMYFIVTVLIQHAATIPNRRF